MNGFKYHSSYHKLNTNRQQSPSSNQQSRSNQQLSKMKNTDKHIESQLHFLRYARNQKSGTDDGRNVFPGIGKDKYSSQNKTDSQQQNSMNDYQINVRNNTESSSSLKLQQKFSNLNRSNQQNDFYQIGRQDVSSTSNFRQYMNYIGVDSNQQSIQSQFDFFKSIHEQQESKKAKKSQIMKQIMKHNKSNHDLAENNALTMRRNKTDYVPSIDTGLMDSSVSKLKQVQSMEGNRISDFGKKDYTSYLRELGKQDQNDKDGQPMQLFKRSSQNQSNRGSRNRNSQKQNQINDINDLRSPLQSRQKMINKYVQMFAPRIEHIRDCLNGRINNLMELNQSIMKTTKEIKKCLDCKYFQKLRKILFRDVGYKKLRRQINFNDIQDFVLLKPGIFEQVDDISSKVKLDQDKMQMIESFIRNLDEVLAIKFISKYKETNDSLIKSRHNFQKQAQKYIKTNRHFVGNHSEEQKDGKSFMNTFTEILGLKDDQDGATEYFKLQDTVQKIKKLEIQYGPINELSLGNRLIIQSIQNFAFDQKNQDSQYE